jgi:NitT/TauT family transport system permease protein
MNAVTPSIIGRLLWPHGLFAALLAAAFIAPHGGVAAYRLALLAAAIETAALAFAVRHTSAETRTAGRDVSGILFIVLLVWQIATVHAHAVNPLLLPPPETVLAVLTSDTGELLRGMGRSVGLLAAGYALALLVAVPLGIVTGWYLRLFRASQPIIKILGPLPPVVYVPYAIALLPTFRLAAVWVVFVGAFWPLLARTIQGVRVIPVAQIDAARTLNLTTPTLLRRIVFPAALPAICGGAAVALVFAFVLLTSAELIGASGGIASGLGYYVMYADSIQDHRRVLAGIIVIGLLVVAIVSLSDRLERRLLHWKD